jgi:DNA invertase Pin-like site-specific DNA recombinase
MTAAIYSRVSTLGQNTINQVADLKKLAAERGFTLVKVVEEIESGAKRRPALETLIAEGGFDVLLVWALDRLGRGGALEALTIMEALNKRGISVVSSQERWLDTSADNPMRDVLITFSATIAKMERARLIERTKAGLASARARGVILGHPSTRLVPDWREKIDAWRIDTGGVGLRALRRDLGGVSLSTVGKLLERHPALDDIAA